MKKEILVLSVGGSIIIPDEVNTNFLEALKETLRKHYKTHKFVLVCGGGSTARKYISALKKEGKSKDEMARAGIRATRMNARLLMQIFGKEANDRLPMNMTEVKNSLRKNKIVICGALRFNPRSTSDGTAARLSSLLKARFINMTDVKGLFSDNPKKNPRAKFIERRTWKEFETISLKLKFHAAQHFVLDQAAATIIRKHKIKTYIIGQDTKNLSKLVSGKKFIGTTIEG